MNVTCFKTFKPANQTLTMVITWYCGKLDNVKKSIKGKSVSMGQLSRNRNILDQVSENKR